jgi:hypothetical protein
MNRGQLETVGLWVLELVGLLGALELLYHSHHWGAMIAFLGVLGGASMFGAARDLRAEEGVTLQALGSTLFSLWLIGLAVWVAVTKFEGMGWAPAAAAPLALIVLATLVSEYLERRRPGREAGAQAQSDRLREPPGYYPR